MEALVIVVVVVAVLVLIGLAMALKIVEQYEQGVLFRLGRVRGLRNPGLRVIIPFIDVPHRVSLRIVTMPIQSQASSPATTSASTCPRSRGAASDTMMAHPLALQPRNLQSLVEIGVDKNTTVVFPAPLMSTIEELGSFLARAPGRGPRRCGCQPERHRGGEGREAGSWLGPGFSRSRAPAEVAILR